jgi:cytochrome b561
VAGQSWLADALAAAMIVIAVYCASRLVVSRRRHRPTEADADALHVVMGVAMAGMLVPRLSPLPSSAWEAAFGAAAAWFAWQAARRIPAGGWRCPYPVPHMVECAAMLYMLQAMPGPRSPSLGMPMPGMSGTAGAGGSFPVLALVLALFMLGYVVWTTDRLASLTRARTASPAPRPARDHARVPVISGALPALSPDDAPGISSIAGTRHEHPAPMLAPRLAACYKIAMGITMGYMLITML